MKKRFKDFRIRLLVANRPAIRRGFTLIEVIVGLVLMATVMASMLVAHRRHQSLLSFAAKQSKLCNVADRWLETSFQNTDGFPINQKGIVPASMLVNSNLGNSVSVSQQLVTPVRWSTRVIGTRPVAGVPVAVVRFRVVDASGAFIELDIVQPDPTSETSR